MKTLLIMLLAATMVAQEGQPVNVSISSPTSAYTTLIFYSGSDTQYVCKAKSTQSTITTFSRTAATPYRLTNIVVATNVGTVTTASANGYKVNDKIVITGATVDTDLNGTYAIATISSSTVFTIATSAVADATYNESTLQFTSTVPRTTLPIWGIQKLTSVASQVTAVQWANGTSGTTQICDNRATLAYQ